MSRWTLTTIIAMTVCACSGSSKSTAVDGCMTSCDREPTSDGERSLCKADCAYPPSPPAGAKRGDR